MKLKRRESREVAFSLIFEWGFREEETVEEIIQQAEIGRSVAVDDFARNLAEQTIQSCAQLDELIQGYSHKWKLNRIPRVTLAALRMALCELSQFSDIPVGATINEAVELVKKYASEEDAAYLNGILGQFHRDRTGEEIEPEQAEESGEDAGEEPPVETVPKDAAADEAAEATTVEPSSKEEVASETEAAPPAAPEAE